MKLGNNFTYVLDLDKTRANLFPNFSRHYLITDISLPKNYKLTYFMFLYVQALIGVQKVSVFTYFVCIGNSKICSDICQKYLRLIFRNCYT